MRETAMEVDHESEDARREAERECRGGGVAVAGWSEAMAALGRRGEAAEREWRTGGFCWRPSYPEFRQDLARCSALTHFCFSIREIAAAAEHISSKQQ